MYPVEWLKVFSRSQRTGSVSADSSQEAVGEAGAKVASSRRSVVSGTVWALGLTSLLTDISSEMVASILPVYLVLHLGISPIAFGIMDGIYQGVAALVRVAGGVLADRWRRHKEVAAFGYGLSAACRLLILVAGNAWGTIAAIITLDRIGKGVRTAPRDALIACRTPAASLAAAFGVHRAMDAVGAMLGPVVAFALLAVMPERFDILFIASFGVAIAGLGAILLFVPAVIRGEQAPSTGAEASPSFAHERGDESGNRVSKPISLRSVLQLLAEARFRALVITGSLLSLATISDSFIFLILQRRLDIGITAFPLFYVGTSLFTALFAIPCGRLADRIGRKRVMFGGYGVLALVYVITLLPVGGGLSLIVAAVLLLGLFYAATDGVLTAMAAAALPKSHSGSGLAVLATATNLARLVASVAYGFFWSQVGIGQATFLFLMAIVGAIVVAAFILRRFQQHAI